MKKLTAAFIALAMATSVSACQSTGVTPQQQAQIGADRWVAWVWLG